MHLIHYMLILISLPTVAQTSQLGRFSADFNRGCAPLTINLSEHDTFGAITRQYFYENENEVTTSTTHTYNDPGTYTLVQLLGTDFANPKTDTLVIDVLTSTIPVYTYHFCDGKEIQLEINDPTYDSYEVLFANNQAVNLLDGASTSYVFGTAEPLSIDVKGIYSYAADNCGVSRIILNQVFDNLTAPIINLAELVQTCENVFNLSIEAGVESEVLYQIEMNKSGGSYSSIYNGLLSNSILLEDLSINQSDTEYCLRIDAINACNGNRTVGTSFCQSLDSHSLSPIRNLYSTYSGSQIQLFLEDAVTGSYLFQRSFDKQSYSTIGKSQTNFMDDSPFFGRQYFYQVSYQDTCSGIWGLQTTSPPFIKSHKITANKYQIAFDEAEHQTGENFTYSAQLSGNGSTDVFSITGDTFEIMLPANLGEKQTLQIIGTSTIYSVVSNTLNFELEFIVHAPKAFTPNGDGLNDELVFFGLGDNTATLRIYTRWGQQIYGEVSNAPAWDGRINGSFAEEGIYVYEISIPKIANHIQKGTFALIKR